MSKSLPKLRLLVVSTLPNDAEQIASQLRNAGYPTRTRWCNGPVEALEVLDEYHANIILCAEDLPEVQISASLEKLGAARPGVPILTLGERSDQQAATEAMKMGARDRVTRSEPDHLRLVLSREVHSFMQSRELDDFRARMAEVETRHDALLMEASEPIAYVHEGIHTRANPAYARLFGFDEADAVTDMPLMDFVHKDDRDTLKRELKACLRENAAGKAFTLRSQRIDGGSEPVDFHLSPIRIGDTDQVEVIARASGPSAGTPALDHSTERHALYEALKHACGQAPEGDETLRALFYIAVDDFENIQTSHGFAEADQLAEELEAVMSRSGHKDDAFFHFAPGEFILLGSRDSEEDVEKSAQDWREEVRTQQFEIAGQALPVTISVAACPLPGVGVSPQTVLRRARETVRMIAARMGDEVRVVTVGGSEDEAKRGDQYWLQKIKQALRNDRFELTYQSIASLEGDSSSHFEVTLRMLDERNQEILAAEFMPTAERHELGQALDRWVVQRALDVLSRQSQKAATQLFLKLSEDSLTSKDFQEWLAGQLTQNKALASRLIFQLKVPVVQSLGKAALEAAKTIKKSGAKLALERVGASPRTLALLDTLVVDYLKLDPVLTENLEIDQERQDNVTRIMEHARNKAIKTIAERVEKANSMATLWQLGINFVQGHYVQEPEVVLITSDVQAP